MADLKRATVKTHGHFDQKLSIKKGEVTIKFTADVKDIDLNTLALMLKDGATAIFVSDQTELPTDDSKPKNKQLELVK